MLRNGCYDTAEACQLVWCHQWCYRCYCSFVVNIERLFLQISSATAEAKPASLDDAANMPLLLLFCLLLPSLLSLQYQPSSFRNWLMFSNDFRDLWMYLNVSSLMLYGFHCVLIKAVLFLFNLFDHILSNIRGRFWKQDVGECNLRAAQSLSLRRKACCHRNLPWHVLLTTKQSFLLLCLQKGFSHLTILLCFCRRRAWLQQLLSPWLLQHAVKIPVSKRAATRLCIIPWVFTSRHKWPFIFR